MAVDAFRFDNLRKHGSGDAGTFSTALDVRSDGLSQVATGLIKTETSYMYLQFCFLFFFGFSFSYLVISLLRQAVDWWFVFR